ncbi:putative glycoside hydrolase [Terriglobus saanensis]|nr:putative glycoside hydrolase [Terriglobus saanensis]
MPVMSKSQLQIFAALPLFFVAALLHAAATVQTRIVDATTNQPVADATVTVNGKLLTADAAGIYTIPAEAQFFGARAPGYLAATFVSADAAKNGGTFGLKPFAVKALYLSEFGVSSSIIRNSALDIIHHGGANALVVNIKSDHGLLVYPSEIPLAKSIGARKLTTIKSLTDLVKTNHAQGIYMIARIVTFKDDPLANARPDLAVHLEDGALFRDREHLSWTDPFQPEVRAYNIAIAVEAAKAGFDEVQFDYVRFPDAATKLKFSGPTDEAGRVKAISDFLAQAHTALIPYNVFQSADIFGYVLWNTNDTGIGQHLEEVVKIVDYVCPMLYPSGFKFGIPGHPKPMASTDDIYNTIKLTLDNAEKRTHANPRKFRPWLQAFRDYAFDKLVFGPTEVSAQIRAATDAHMDGWLLWNPHNRYTGIGLGETKAAPLATLPGH